MRLLARKNGMALSEHSLQKNVFRKGTEKINNGERINTPTEESIFKYFNLKYRSPEVKFKLIILIVLMMIFNIYYLQTLLLGKRFLRLTKLFKLFFQILFLYFNKFFIF